MLNRRTLYPLAIATVATLAGIAACAETRESPVAADAAHGHMADIRAENTPAVQKWIADLRRTTAHLQDFDARIDAGFDTPILGCMVNPDGPGAQAYHHGNMSRITDPVIDPLEPELVMYEPQKNGSMKLIAVEFIIPFDLVPFTPESEANPPSIHGVDFMPNHTLGIWALHVWNWRQNPDGMFASWNRKVSCEYAG